MQLLNADLHSHSNVSDGTLTPGALAERAAAAGVELWALTDHDEVGGVARAREAALDLGMAFLGGCEISVSYAGETVHVVGLGVDATNGPLVAGLEATRAGRRERAQTAGDRSSPIRWCAQRCQARTSPLREALQREGGPATQDRRLRVSLPKAVGWAWVVHSLDDGCSTVSTSSCQLHHRFFWCSLLSRLSAATLAGHHAGANHPVRRTTRTAP